MKAAAAAGDGLGLSKYSIQLQQVQAWGRTVELILQKQSQTCHHCSSSTNVCNGEATETLWSCAVTGQSGNLHHLDCSLNPEFPQKWELDNNCWKILFTERCIAEKNLKDVFMECVKKGVGKETKNRHKRCPSLGYWQLLNRPLTLTQATDIGSV